MVSKVFQSASGSRWRGLLLHGRGDAAGTFLVLLSISLSFCPPVPPLHVLGAGQTPQTLWAPENCAHSSLRHAIQEHAWRVLYRSPSFFHFSAICGQHPPDKFDIQRPVF